MEKCSKDVCTFSVYMLSSKNGTGPGGFVGYFMTKQEAEDAIQKKYNKNLEN